MWYDQRMIKNTVSLFCVFLLLCCSVAASEVEDFRSTPQRIALVGFYNEFVEPSVEENLLHLTRKALNRYSRGYDRSAISEFSLSSNPDNQFYKPHGSGLSDRQKEFLKNTAENNDIDIVVLGAVRESSQGIEMELQLYDARIDSLSGIVRDSFPLIQRQQSIEQVGFELMDHLDRDGYVHTSRQNYLEKPPILKDGSGQVEAWNQDFGLRPEDLDSGRLLGRVEVGGEKTPFWEEWWFWTLIGGGLITAGSVSYYFLVVNQPPTRASVGFQLP